MLRAPVILLLFAAVAWAQDEAETHRFKEPAHNRKCGMLVPPKLRKKETVPLLLALPDTAGLGSLELDRWRHEAMLNRWAVLSLDIMTSRKRGWHPKEQLEMQEDMEATLAALEEAMKRAPIDKTAIILRGHSGGTYLTLWLGLRRPDLFLGICGDGVVFFKEAIPVDDKYEKVKPDLDLPILLYRGELDNTRARKGTEQARDQLKKAGYKNVTYKTVPKLGHLPDVKTFVTWAKELLKSTKKQRQAVRKLLIEADKIRAQLAKGTSRSVYSKLAKLVQQEAKAGVSVGGAELVAEVSKRALTLMQQAKTMEAGGRMVEAAEVYADVDNTYFPLPVGKAARAEKKRLKQTDAFKADEILRKALRYFNRGDKDKAFTLFEKIMQQYPDTPAAKIANETMK